MLLNGAVLNGAVLNGSPFTWVEGAASVSASADFTADITYVFRASANVTSGEASVVADAVRLHPAEADLECTGALNAVSAQAHAGGAALSGTANIVVFVERVVLAEATIFGASEFFAVAQGFFVNADVTCTADLSADVNYVHAGARADPAACTAAFTADALVYRMATAAVAGSADLYAEYATVAGAVTTYYPYRTLDGTADLVASATCTKVASSAFDTGVEVVARIHIIHAIRASFAVESIIHEVQATFLPLVGANFEFGSATFTADATRVVMPEAAPEGSAEMSGGVLINHAAAADSVNGGVELAATGLIIVPASAAISGTVEISGQMIGYQYGVANCSSSAEMVADGVNLFKTQAVAEIAANSEFVADGLRLLGGGVADVSSSAEFVATARSNMEAEDPPERTMYRTYVDREMRRPFVDRVMREAA